MFRTFGNIDVIKFRIIISYAILGTWIIFYFIQTGLPWGGMDFARTYNVSAMIKDGNALDIYNFSAFLRHLSVGADISSELTTNWLYSPIYSLLLAPLSYLPYNRAYDVYIYLQVVLFIAAGYKFIWFRITDISLLFSSTVLICIFWGQNSLLIAGLYLMAFRYINTRQVIAGICFALATIKPQLGILIPVLLIAGRYYIAGIIAIIGTSFLVAASIACFGSLSWYYYLNNLVNDTISEQHLLSIKSAAKYDHMPSIFTLSSYVGASDSCAIIIQVISACTALTIFIKKRYEWQNNPKTALLYVSILTLFITPYVGIYDYVLAVTMIVSSYISVQNKQFFYAEIVAILLIIYIAFIDVFFLKHIEIASPTLVIPLLVIGVSIYIYKDRRLRFL